MLTDKLVTDVYDFEEIIGKGGFSSVVLAQHLTTKRRVAIKIIDKSELIGNDVLAARVRRECEINLQISHLNIAKVFEIYDSPDDICLVMELLEGGELFDYIAARGRLSEDDARPIMKAIIDSVAYLHGLGIAHRDLKPENILFSTKEHKIATIKLIDFGFAKQEKDDSAVLQTPIGTTAYVAPEVINSTQYRKSVDMWSLGCVLFFMLVGRPPFYSEDEKTIADLASEGKYTIPAFLKLSEAATDLISRLLQKDPARRISAIQALHHRWITGESQQPNENDQASLGSSEEEIIQMKSAINRSIDIVREETEKKADRMDVDAHEPVMLGSALDSPLWQKRREKKRSQTSTDDSGLGEASLHPKESRV